MTPFGSDVDPEVYWRKAKDCPFPIAFPRTGVSKRSSFETLERMSDGKVDHFNSEGNVEPPEVMAALSSSPALTW